MLIRPAELADLPSTVALLADDALDATREDASTPPHADYLAGFAAIAASGNDELFVAVLDGAAVGCFQLTYLPGLAHRGAWPGQIEAVRVAAGQRGNGLGREMIGWAIKRCRARGCRIVQLTTNAQRTDAQRCMVVFGQKEVAATPKPDLAFL